MGFENAGVVQKSVYFDLKRPDNLRIILKISYTAPTVAKFAFRHVFFLILREIYHDVNLSW